MKYFWDRIRWYSRAARIAWGRKAVRVGAISSATGIVIGLLVDIGMTDLVLLVAVSLIGWALELVNTAVERICDLVNGTGYSKQVEIIKDLFGAAPAFTFSAYWICWIILVVPSLIEKLT